MNKQEIHDYQREAIRELTSGHQKHVESACATLLNISLLEIAYQLAVMNETKSKPPTILDRGNRESITTIVDEIVDKEKMK